MPSFFISFFMPNVYTNIITRVAIDNSIPSFIFAGINVNSISFPNDLFISFVKSSVEAISVPLTYVIQSPSCIPVS